MGGSTKRGNPRRKAKRKHAKGTIGFYFREQGGLCKYCKRIMVLGGRADTEATKDHVIPRADGGGRIKNNIVAACRRCNLAKGDMPLEEFMTRFNKASDTGRDGKNG